MRVIVSVQAKRSSSRGLVHYIAHSKTDPIKEPKTREIFNQYSEDSTVEKANGLLQTGISRKRPGNEELHHIVISIKPEDYNRLGINEKEKKTSLKQLIRHTMKTLQESIGAEKLSWAAGIHRNTNNPHIHIAIQKEFFDKDLERKSLRKIPTSLLPHYEKEGEQKHFKRGILIEETTKKLDEIILDREKLQQIPRKGEDRENRTRDQEQQIESKLKARIEKESDILASAILAKFYLEKTKKNLRSLEEHGDKRRFKIFDNITGEKRKMSLFDLGRRAERTADQKVQSNKIVDPVKKDETRNALVTIEIQKNADGIKRIKTILRHLLIKENLEVNARKNDYAKIRPLADKIRQTYRTDNTKLPTPNLSPEELEMLQTASLNAKDIRTANYFERVRKELADTRQIPTRTNDQISRLKAKRAISNLRVRLFENQSQNFEQSKRNFPVQMKGEKWTLAKADSFIEYRLQRERKLIGKIEKAFNKMGFGSSPKNELKLVEIKTTIAEMLDEKSKKLASDLKSERSTLKTLSKFYADDLNPEKEKLETKYNAAELAEIEGISLKIKDSKTFRDSWALQKHRIENAPNKDKISADSFVELKKNTVAGRALSREIISEIEFTRSKDELKLFNKQKNFRKFEIVDEKTGESRFVSLKEVEFNYRGSLLNQTLEFFVENREKRRNRNQLEKIVSERKTELKESIQSARAIYRTAVAETQDYKIKSFFGKVNFTHAPLFTPTELIKIELRIKQTENISEAAKLQNILDSYDHSEAKNLSEILEQFSIENEVSKLIPNKSDRKSQSQEGNTPVADQETREITIENPTYRQSR